MHNFDRCTESSPAANCVRAVEGCELMTHSHEALGLAGKSALLSGYLKPNKKYLIAKQSSKFTSWTDPGPQMFLNGGDEVIGLEGHPGLGGSSGDLEDHLWHRSRWQVGI